VCDIKRRIYIGGIGSWVLTGTFGPKEGNWWAEGDWMHLAHDRDQLHAFMNTVTDSGFQ
jgi:hypothetical protein